MHAYTSTRHRPRIAESHLAWYVVRQVYYKGIKAMASNPISVRLSDVHRSYMTLQTGSTTSVIEEGLDRMSRLRSATHLPLYPRLVDDEAVDSAVEEAVSAACSVLDELFPEGAGIEFKGVNSNFQGLLAAHMKAMLTGTEAADRRYRTQVNALLATDHSFGRLPRGIDENAESIGYTVVKLAQRRDEPDLFLDPDDGYCELARLLPGGLYTSVEYCVKGVLARMEREGLSPRAEDVRMCAIRITGSGPLQVRAVAALNTESPMDAASYLERSNKRTSARAG